MNVEEYEKMYTMEDTYWWFQGRQQIVKSMVQQYVRKKPRPGRVLDVGCGTGLLLQRLSALRPVGIDFSQLALRFSRRRGAKNLLRGDVTSLPIQDSSLDLIFALDLIEHIEHDDQLVREFQRVLASGGHLIATVPAHQVLWSDHDVALHHFRRYSWRSFRKLLTGAGLRPVKYSYAISFTYYPIVLFRLLQLWWQRSHGVEGPARPKTHLIPLPTFLNLPLIWVLQLEAFLLRYVNLPVGVSLLAVCRKD
jgi:ubiquinone/menaquinone biosynthesis C-methylase UbiE